MLSFGWKAFDRLKIIFKCCKGIQCSWSKKIVYLIIEWNVSFALERKKTQKVRRGFNFSNGILGVQ